MKKLISAPARLPIELDDIKDQLRLERNYTREDAQLYNLAGVAGAYIEGHCQRALITQAWRAYFRTWVELAQVSRLPMGMLQTVTGVYYVGENGESRAVDAGGYIVSGVGTDTGKIVFNHSFDFPALSYPDFPVRVEYVCGYGDEPASVPQDIVHAIKLIITHFYANREPMDKQQFAFGYLLENYRLKEVF